MRRPTRKPVDPLTMRQAIECIDAVVPPTTPIFCDIGNAMCHAIRHLRRRAPGSWHLSLVLGGMGNALGQAIGACVGKRQPTIALVGDGAALMCIGELRTAVEQRLPLVVIIFNNGGWGMVEQGRNLDFAGAGLPSMLFTPKARLAPMAQAVGASALTVTRLCDLGPSLRQCLSHQEPTLLELWVDPNEPAPFESRRHTLTTGGN